MANSTRRSGAERVKYGICLNDECPKCKGKEVQQVPMRKEFVCEECGKELRECPPPKQSVRWPLYAGMALFIAAVAGGICFFSLGEGEKDALVEADTTAVAVCDTDTVMTATATEVIEESENQEAEKVEEATRNNEVSKPAVNKPAQASNGSLRLSYGTYSGSMKGGYPHGQGKLTYSVSRQINRNDMKARMADAGDYVIGEFYNGFVVYGKHYDASGNLIESLNFGVGDESSYDSK